MKTPKPAAHTPTPWKIGAWKQTDNEEADCGIFAEPFAHQAYSICRAPRYVTKPEWQANAAFIVRAVNAHAELLAALKNLVCYGDVFLHYKGDPNPYELAKQAIAKAESL